MSPTTLPAARRASGLTGQHVLFSMIGFFGIVFAVNGVLLYQALATHSGLVAQEPYRKGLAYNTRIDAGERQQSLGWTDAVTVDKSGQISVAFRDSTGAAVSGLQLTGIIGRPSTVRHDKLMKLNETDAGRYTVATGPLEEGAWLLNIEAREASVGLTEGAPVYRLKRRLWLKP